MLCIEQVTFAVHLLIAHAQEMLKEIIQYLLYYLAFLVVTMNDSKGIRRQQWKQQQPSSVCLSPLCVCYLCVLYGCVLIYSFCLSLYPEVLLQLPAVIDSTATILLQRQLLLVEHCYCLCILSFLFMLVEAMLEIS